MRIFLRFAANIAAASLPRGPRVPGRREAVDKQASDHPAAAGPVFSTVIQKMADEGLVRHHGYNSARQSLI